MARHFNSVLIQAAHGPSTPALSDLVSVDVLGVAGCETYWIAELAAREDWYDNSAGGVMVPNSSAIDSFQQRSALLARVSWSSAGGARQLIFDLAGGLRLAVFGTSVQLEVLGPAGPSGLRDASPGGPLVTGSAVSLTRVDAQIVATATALGLRTGQITLRQHAPAGVLPAPREIPAGATSLQIFEAAPATPPTSLAWVFRDRLGTAIGTVPLVAGASSRVRVPGPARSVQTTGATSSTTIFSLAFGMEW